MITLGQIAKLMELDLVVFDRHFHLPRIGSKNDFFDGFSQKKNKIKI